MDNLQVLSVQQAALDAKTAIDANRVAREAARRAKVLFFSSIVLGLFFLAAQPSLAASACAGRNGPIFGGNQTNCFCKSGDSVEVAEDSAMQACLAAPQSSRGSGCSIAARSTETGWKAWLWAAESMKSYDCQDNFRNQIIPVGPIKSEASLDPAIQQAIRSNREAQGAPNHPEAHKIKFYFAKLFDPGTGAGARAQHEKQQRVEWQAATKRCIANLKPGDSLKGWMILEIKGTLVKVQGDQYMFGGYATVDGKSVSLPDRNDLVEKWVRATDLCG